MNDVSRWVVEFLMIKYCDFGNFAHQELALTDKSVNCLCFFTIYPSTSNLHRDCSLGTDIT